MSPRISGAGTVTLADAFAERRALMKIIAAQGVQPGVTDEADWKAAAELMQRSGLVDTLVPANELFTNEFVE